MSTPEGGSVSISLHSHKQISSSSQEADVKSTILCRVDCVLRVGADTCAPLSDMTGQEAVRGDHYPARPVCVIDALMAFPVEMYCSNGGCLAESFSASSLRTS